MAFNPATYFFNMPLKVHRTPLDWLKARCDGCVVVVPSLGRWVLNEVPGRVAGQDIQHAQELAVLTQSIVDVRRFVAPIGEAA